MPGFALPPAAGERGPIAATGLLVLAGEMVETGIDDVSEEVRPLARRAEDAACAAVAITAPAAGAAWAAAIGRHAG